MTLLVKFQIIEAYYYVWNYDPWPNMQFYKLYIQRIRQEPSMCHKKWENDSETSVDDWRGIYSMSYV
jgi:hypothetical protein